eukprot:NODE_6051_length_578_cov_17.337029_g5886_i0.p1 GENE.NODE_6051_length_578_cov_17.337029_g5886_i0~~NODE_6051_length_578_cov_17.337029_g5886_i0.p1  ORF type:complete len:178 (-),score=18.70 NODE_6051_length_578_cov_17.337029_g5886_i0:8-541(-)
MEASILNPFPKAFLKNSTERDYLRLESCLATLPVAKKIHEPTPSLTPDQQALLEHIAGDCVRLKLSSIKQVEPHFGQLAASLYPNWVFELKQNAASPVVKETACTGMKACQCSLLSPQETEMRSLCSSGRMFSFVRCNCNTRARCSIGNIPRRQTEGTKLLLAQNRQVTFFPAESRY